MAAAERPARPPFPARVGLALVEPRRALQAVAVVGGGLGDATWLFIAGLVAFRFRDLIGALDGFWRRDASAVFQQTFFIVREELIEAGLAVLVASVAITVLAGRDRRDPSRDLELGALCYVPFFAVRAGYRTLASFAGPWPQYDWIAIAVASLPALGMIAMAVAVVRRRAPAGASPPVDVAPAPSLRARVAVTVLAAVVGAAVFAPRREAPAFSLPRIDEKPGEVALGTLRGKVVLLDFWATWCPPCVKMMPSLHQLYGEWQGRGVEFVGINSDGPDASLDEIRRFMHRGSYPMVIDAEGRVGEDYKVKALPHLVLVGRDGVVLRRFTGITAKDELAHALADALRE